LTQATGVPKPVQKPHPPIWVACSNRETIHLAAQLGIGALTFAFVDPSESKKWVDDYYQTLKNECVPIGHAVNPNIAMVTSFSVHRDDEEAVRRGLDGFLFFNYALGHHYSFGQHWPGRTNIWEMFESAKDATKDQMERSLGGIGTPDSVRSHLGTMGNTGVDQTVFIQQGGKDKHEDIMDALDLFATDIMSEFKDGEAKRLKRKDEELAPFVEAVFKRKDYMQELADEEIPVIYPYGFDIAEVDTSRLDVTQKARVQEMKKMRKAAESVKPKS